MSQLTPQCSEQIAIVQKGGDPMALVWDEEKNRIIEFEGSKSVLV